MREGRYGDGKERSKKEGRGRQTEADRHCADRGVKGRGGGHQSAAHECCVAFLANAPRAVREVANTPWVRGLSSTLHTLTCPPRAPTPQTPPPPRVPWLRFSSGGRHGRGGGGEGRREGGGKARSKEEGSHNASCFVYTTVVASWPKCRIGIQT